MHSILPYLLIILYHTGLTLVASQCDFPTRFQGTWWHSLDAGNDVIVEEITEQAWTVGPDGGAATGT